jgi:hypothetical protein
VSVTLFGSGGRSSASGLVSLQAGDHITPTPYSDRWLQPPSAAGSRAGLPGFKSTSKSKSCYDRRSVCQSVLMSSPIYGQRPAFCYRQTVAGLLTWGAFSDQRAGLSFTIAAGPRQRNNSRVRVPRDSWPYFIASVSRLPQPGGPGPCIYILDPLTQQETPLPKVLLLLHDAAIGTDCIENNVPSGTSIGYVSRRDVFHFCVTVYCATA